jgi:DNA-binding SARP family transcriptional activator
MSSRVMGSDVMAFEQLSKAMQDSKTQDVCLEARQLYRGAFLEGFTPGNLAIFEDWIRQQQTKHERKYLALLEKLIDRFSEIHAYDAAIECSQACLEIDELAEHIHRRLIEFYVITGNHSAAHRQLETCEVVIQRKLAQPLLPETVAALQLVVSKQVASLQTQCLIV